MWDGLLFLSFFNLFSMLPLFAAWRLGENLEGSNSATIWEQLISSPPLLCSAVILIAGFLAWRMARAGDYGENIRWYLGINFSLMFLCWVVPRALHLTLEIQRAAIETWTVASGVALLLVSLRVPFLAIAKALRPPVPRDTPPG